jgi:hypothetical protein
MIKKRKKIFTQSTDQSGSLKKKKKKKKGEGKREQSGTTYFTW